MRMHSLVATWEEAVTRHTNVYRLEKPLAGEEIRASFQGP